MKKTGAKQRYTRPDGAREKNRRKMQFPVANPGGTCYNTIVKIYAAACGRLLKELAVSFG